MRTTLTAIILAIFLAPSPSADLPAWADETRLAAKSPGLGLVVMRAGEKPRIVVDGVRVAGEPDRLSADDRWQWGSITKSMTATLVARLVEKGTVAWDDTVESRLGERLPEMRDEYRQASFRHLLSHRAGLQPFIPGVMFAFFTPRPEEPIADRLRWVEIALKQEPVGPMTESFTYSNNGYIVAAAMLEAATGESWETLIERELFKPLGLKSAGFGSPGAGHPRGHFATEDGHRAAPLGGSTPGALGPSGLVHLSLADMARYLAAHASRDPGLLKEASYELLHDPPFGGDYAMGWTVTTPQGRWHAGSDGQCYAEVAFDLESGTVAAVVANDAEVPTVQPPLRELLTRLMNRPDAP